jgi:hypothetical protein
MKKKLMSLLQNDATEAALPLKPKRTDAAAADADAECCCCGCSRGCGCLMSSKKMIKMALSRCRRQDRA